MSSEFSSTLADIVNYVRQLSKMSNQNFVLGFNTNLRRTLEQCEEVRAAVDLISAAPNIPLRTYGALASKLAAAMEGVMEVLDPASNIRWKNGWPEPPHGCDWQIDISSGSCAKTS